MNVRKAVITAAGRGTRQYPASKTVQKEMFPLVDVDGFTKPVIQIIAEEALAAGIEAICIVTAPDDAEMYRRHFRGLSAELYPAFAGKDWAVRASDQLARLESVLHYAPQPSPEGYGHAVYCARDWVGDEPFLHLLGDHVYISSDPMGRCCARQLVEVFDRVGCTVSAVKRTPERLLQYFGTVRGEPLPETAGLYRVTAMVEKPTISLAERELRTPRLRPEEYLCFFGMHVFTPTIFDCLDFTITHGMRERGEFQLTSAQAMLAEQAPYAAFEACGERYDMGVPFGLAETQLALALHSPMRADMIATLDRMLAEQAHMRPPSSALPLVHVAGSALRQATRT